MEAVAPMPAEIVVLGWAVVLLIVQIVLQTLAGIGEFGARYELGPRDEARVFRGLYGGRVSRALQNLIETFAVFAALALALAVTGKSGGLGAVGAWIWFWARVIYVPAYVMGIPLLRTFIWAVSMVGLILMLIRLLG